MDAKSSFDLMQTPNDAKCSIGPIQNFDLMQSAQSIGCKKSIRCKMRSIILRRKFLILIASKKIIFSKIVNLAQQIISDMDTSFLLLQYFMLYPESLKIPHTQEQNSQFSRNLSHLFFIPRKQIDPMHNRFDAKCQIDPMQNRFDAKRQIDPM